MAIAGGLSYIEITTERHSFQVPEETTPTSETCTRLVEEERDNGRLTVTTVVVGGKGEESLGGKEVGTVFSLFLGICWVFVLLVDGSSCLSGV